MGGIAFSDDDVDEWDSYLSSAREDCESRTVVLVGKAGNGKSGTGNSILGERAFLSKPGAVGVTGTSELRTTVLENGQTLNVIDTPEIYTGLLDYSRKPEFLREEILKCVKMAKDGIHAVLLVLSVRSRFSVEEKTAVGNLLTFFGDKISEYMIVVFTGDDELDEIGETLDVYLDNNCPEELKEILELCCNRRVLFDNKSKDVVIKSEQLKQLLSLLNEVVENNGGKPFTNELFIQLQDEACKLRQKAAELDSMNEDSEQQISVFKEEFLKSYQQQFKGLADTVDLKLNHTMYKLKLDLAEEKGARLQAEREAKASQAKSDEEIRSLTKELEKTKKETEELRNKSNCTIM